MPVSDYFGGSGSRVMRGMRQTYGNAKRAKSVFYATANKQRQTPKDRGEGRPYKRGSRHDRKRPPELRQGEGTSRCANCRHFGQRACRLYGGYPVKPGQVCDSFESR